ncbi:hypothetical protein N894_1217 [Francisella tularensis subsp. novicida PA10-7858]|nr:hypothetical protein N894_1217 [Francisella tularensis subsp. novicida PA10-7858]
MINNIIFAKKEAFDLFSNFLFWRLEMQFANYLFTATKYDTMYYQIIDDVLILLFYSNFFVIIFLLFTLVISCNGKIQMLIIIKN